MDLDQVELPSPRGSFIFFSILGGHGTTLRLFIQAYFSKIFSQIFRREILAWANTARTRSTKTQEPTKAQDSGRGSALRVGLGISGYLPLYGVWPLLCTYFTVSAYHVHPWACLTAAWHRARQATLHLYASDVQKTGQHRPHNSIDATKAHHRDWLAQLRVAGAQTSLPRAS